MNQKLKFLCFRGIHNSLPSIWAKLGDSQIKIDHKIYHFIADSLLKDAVLTVGVNLRLCLLSLWYRRQENKNLALKLGMQTYQIFTNNDKVCNYYKSFLYSLSCTAAFIKK